MFWTIVLAIATGMRAMTAIAVICWAAYLGYLPVEGTWAAWTGSLASVIVFTALALFEYFNDTRPKTPSRTSAFPATARLCLAVLVGLLMATVLEQPKVGGILLGILGVLIGTYGGYRVRMWGARLVGHDLPVALAESALAFGFSVLALAHIHREIAVNAEHLMNMLTR